MKYLIFLFMWQIQVVAAAPESQCKDQRKAYYEGKVTTWPSQCGRRPSSNFLAFMKKDCSGTLRRIEEDRSSGGVGSWVANWSGVYAEETCYNLKAGDPL